MTTAKSKRVFIAALALLLAFGLVAAPVVAQRPEMVKVLIEFTEAPDADEKEIVHVVGGIIKHTYHLIPAIAAWVPETAIDELREDLRVISLELDGQVSVIGQTLPWGVDRIGAPRVHAGHNRGTGVRVAILDTGIDLHHRDLLVAGNVTFVAGTTTGHDDHGHGTHVAGTVAARDNAIGVIGVAPEAALFAVKVLDRWGSGWWSDIIAGIEWSVLGPDGRARTGDEMQVINMSLGARSAPGTVRRAVDEAFRAGLVLVAAAGNERGGPVLYPAAFDSVIAVSATDRFDGLAWFSSVGPQVELAAPGVDIHSTLLTGAYGRKSGTSMASPHVAGTAALVIHSRTVRDLDGLFGIANEVRRRMNATATDLGAPRRDPQFGYGLVSAVAAVVEPPPPPPPPPDVDD